MFVIRLCHAAMKRRNVIFVSLGFALLVACKAEKTKPAEAAEASPAAEKAISVKRVKLQTNQGDIVLELNLEKAPITSKNFLQYVEAKHYDGTVFHRVIDSFMIQGGGFFLDGEKLVEKETGAGIPNESQNGLLNEKGTIAMARTSDPNSATAQFFINVENNESLNYPSHGGYAVFGKVVEGMDVVEKIRVFETSMKNLVMRHPRSGEMIESRAGDVPVEAIVIKKATAE